MSTVSVIIPAFNQARFLGEAIRSVLDQSHPELEIVVVDDGSTDGTRDVAGSFSNDARVKYFFQTNQGLPGARNRGIAESTGDYLCFLDADDYYHPDKLLRQVELLDSDPTVGFAYCDITQIDEAGAVMAEQYSVSEARPVLHGNIFEQLLVGGFFPPHTVMVRRSVLDDAGVFHPDLGGHADYELWLRFSGRGHRAGYINEKLAFYRRYPNSMSKDTSHMDATRLEALRIVMRLFPDLAAQALTSIQRTNRDLYMANEWLRTQWDATIRKMEQEEASGDHRSGRPFSLLSQVRQATQLLGSAEQMAIWDVAIDNRSDRVLFMQPPARSLFTIPEGTSGRFEFAVMIHPDAWDKSGDGCGFDITVDGSLALSIELDPHHRAGDRQWREFSMGIPDCSSGRHEIVLETRGLGGSVDFRWALWRDLRFIPTVSTPSTILERNTCEQP